jgi:hypothetical protein
MTKESVQGFALVNCEPSLSTESKKQACSVVLRRIKDVNGVKDAYKTSNPEADFVVFVEADSVGAVQDVIDNIKSIPGIMEVIPKIEMPA